MHTFHTRIKNSFISPRVPLTLVCYPAIRYSRAQRSVPGVCQAVAPGGELLSSLGGSLCSAASSLRLVEAGAACAATTAAAQLDIAADSMDSSALAYPLLLSLLAGLSTSIGGLIAVNLSPGEGMLAFLLGIGELQLHRGCRDAALHNCSCCCVEQPASDAEHATLGPCCWPTAAAVAALAPSSNQPDHVPPQHQPAHCPPYTQPFLELSPSPPLSPAPPRPLPHLVPCMLLHSHTAIGVMATVSCVELWWRSAAELHNPLGVTAAVLGGAVLFALLDLLLPKPPDTEELLGGPLGGHQHLTTTDVSWGGDYGRKVSKLVLGVGLWGSITKTHASDRRSCPPA